MSFNSGVLTELKKVFDRGDLMTKPIRQYVPKPELASRPQVSRLKKARTVWSGPGLNYNNDGELPAGSVVTLFEMPIISDVERRSYKWAEVDAQRGGWLLYDDQTFEPVKDETPPPAPLPVHGEGEQETPKPSDPPAPVDLPERKARTWTITLMATDEEAAQFGVLMTLILDALTKLAGAIAPISDLISRLVIEDMSKETQT